MPDRRGRELHEDDDVHWHRASDDTISAVIARDVGCDRYVVAMALDGAPVWMIEVDGAELERAD